MTIDLPHMLATAVIIFGVLWALEHSGLLQGASKLKRTSVTFGCLFLVIFILNLVWPYGAGSN